MCVESNKNGNTQNELGCEQMATVLKEPGVATASHKVNELSKNPDSDKGQQYKCDKSNHLYAHHTWRPMP